MPRQATSHKRHMSRGASQSACLEPAPSLVASSSAIDGQKSLLTEYPGTSVYSSLIPVSITSLDHGYLHYFRNAW